MPLYLDNSRMYICLYKSILVGLLFIIFTIFDV
jgi:hypothetical protein